MVEKLSPRQREVLRLAARGLTNREIASILGVSAETVRTHLASILERLEVSNRTEAAVAWHAWEAGAERVAEVLQRPAIAVLPLLPLEPGPRAATIASGLTRDLLGLFSAWCWFPVIAYTSSHDARTLGATSQEIGQRLGARFLVDGALRSSRSAWRITVAIVDTTDGHLVWTDTQDFLHEALFDVQDEVCQAIVAAAYPRLIATVHARLPRTPRPEDAQAWELAHGALVLHDRREREANARAQEAFGAALAREPALVLGHYGLGLAVYDRIQNQWGPRAEGADRLLACAERCVELAPHMAEGHYLVARYFQTRGDHDRAVTALQEAIAHNPSFAAAYALLGQTLVITGRHDEGLARMQQACRLGPRSFVAGMAVARFSRGDYGEALASAEHAIATHPRYPFLRALAAACAWWAGQPEVAAAHARALATMQPEFEPARFLHTFGAEFPAVEKIARALEAVAAHR
jgi:TolB-like protein/tetratricopeptide (TPR) repeat protein